MSHPKIVIVLVVLFEARCAFFRKMLIVCRSAIQPAANYQHHKQQYEQSRNFQHIIKLVNYTLHAHNITQAKKNGSEKTIFVVIF